MFSASKDRGEKLAKYVEATFAEIDAVLKTTPETSDHGYISPAALTDLETGVVGSINTEIIERAGGRNVAQAAGQSGLVRASMEQVIVADPEIVLTWDRNFFDRVKTGPALGRHSRHAREARVSRANGALRLDRPSAVTQSRDRAEMAGGPVLSGQARQRPARNHARRSTGSSTTWIPATPNSTR